MNTVASINYLIDLILIAKLIRDVTSREWIFLKGLQRRWNKPVRFKQSTDL